MTVAELIRKLQEVEDQNLPVEIAVMGVYEWEVAALESMEIASGGVYSGNVLILS